MNDDDEVDEWKNGGDDDDTIGSLVMNEAITGSNVRRRDERNNHLSSNELRYELLQAKSRQMIDEDECGTSYSQ